MDGVCSEVFKILNQVFQGTVLGPPLWNVCFRDVDEVTSRNGFSEYKFADDLTVMKSFCASADNGDINDHNPAECFGRVQRVHRLYTV